MIEAIAICLAIYSQLRQHKFNFDTGNVESVAADGTRKRPVLIHRAPFGSLERLIGILIEQYAGDFPLWLAPEQVRLLPVTADHWTYADDAAAQMRLVGVRVEVDKSGERLGKMIRNSEKAKIPVMSVIGDKEVEAQSLSIRTRKEGDLGAIALPEVLNRLKKALDNHGDF